MSMVGATRVTSKKNWLWFEGALEAGTIVAEHPNGLVIVRGLKDDDIKTLIMNHNYAIRHITEEV